MSRRGFAHALWPGLWLAGGLAVLAFALSFLALRAVGIASGVDASISWMFPVIIDGFIVLATWATWRFRAHGLRGAWYPMGALVVFSAVSLTGNALHAHPVAVGDLLLARWAAAAFSAVPPVALLAASHMLVMIATHRARHRAEDDAAAAAPAAQIDAQHQEHLVDEAWTPGGEAPATGAAPSEAPTSSAALAPAVTPVLEAAGREVLSARRLHAVPSPGAGEDDPLAEWVREQVRRGRPTSGKQAVEDGIVGAESTARRRLRQLRETNPALFEPAGAGSAVGRS